VLDGAQSRRPTGRYPRLRYPTLVHATGLNTVIQELHKPNLEDLWFRRNALIYMVPRGGIEPPTRGFSVLCSTN
jgi:hypothetical protein